MHVTGTQFCSRIVALSGFVNCLFVSLVCQFAGLLMFSLMIGFFAVVEYVRSFVLAQD